MSHSTSHWKDQLRESASRARADLIGLDKITHLHHARLVCSALAAFGSDPAALLFIETLPASGYFPRPDLILIHPALGVVVIENKGINLHDILSVANQTLTLNRNGVIQLEDPFAQAERIMFTLKDLIKSKTDQTLVSFHRMVAMPAIDRPDFAAKFSAHWGADALFADAFESTESFARQVFSYCHDERERVGRRSILSPHATETLRHILKGRATLYSSRQLDADARDAQLLGSQIHATETTLKQLTPQQLELMKLDVRGQHRLFRGVAGSGKSLLLAALAARLMVRSEEESASLFAAAQQPRVLVVCFNRTLVHHLRSKLAEEYRRLAYHPETTPLPFTVTHIDGLFRTLADNEPSLRWNQPFNIDTDRAERARGICAQFAKLDPTIADPLKYDAIFVDEAQDLEGEEIQLLLQLVRKDSADRQTLVIFYDNAQNIYGVSPPVWESLGINIVGRTTFMDKCLRNTRETIELAFNVLVGSFAAPQVRVTTRQFADLASLRTRDLVIESDDRIQVTFAPRTGPVPQVKIFSTGAEEREYALNIIRTLWRQEKVLPSDILILYPTHKDFEQIKLDAINLLAEQYAVRSVNRDNDAEKNLPLIQDRTMTFSTIHSAKGYDAPVVILLGTDLLANDKEGRASFYVAATRAKIKLYVLGVKTTHRPAELLEEIAKTSQALHPNSLPGC